MKRSGWLILAGLLLFIGTLGAQTQHGLDWTWPAVTADTAGNPITVSGYNIYCANTAAGPFVKANASPLASPAYLQTGLTVGAIEFCQVTAMLGTEESARSATGSALFQFPPVAPGVPGAIPQ